MAVCLAPDASRVHAVSPACTGVNYRELGGADKVDQALQLDFQIFIGVVQLGKTTHAVVDALAQPVGVTVAHAAKGGKVVSVIQNKEGATSRTMYSPYVRDLVRRSRRSSESRAVCVEETGLVIRVVEAPYLPA